VTRPILVVIDGAKALAGAVKAVFDHPVIHRCQLHYVERRIMWCRAPSTLVQEVNAWLRSA
jgi:transposase-like protein